MLAAGHLSSQGQATRMFRLRGTHHQSIRRRLTLSFVVVAILMLFGWFEALRHFNILRQQTEYLYAVDLQAVSVMRLSVDILTFRDGLIDVAKSRSAVEFQRAIKPLRTSVA